MSKVFLIDVAKCNGCHNCQLACKDEHCNQAWLPYAEAQPDHGQFWCKLEQKTRGQVPVVRLSYIPKIGAQTEAIREYAPEALADREDGLIVLDPAKCKGRRDIAEKFEGVYYNDELDICQGCTGCAHLLDDGWDVPRCVDACPTDAIRFGEVDDFAEELAVAERLDEKSNVYYLNLPKRFVAGTVVDLEAQEVLIGARVAVYTDEGSVVATGVTDDFGDFMFDQLGEARYTVEVEEWGYAKKAWEVDLTEKDVTLAEMAMDKR